LCIELGIQNGVVRKDDAKPVLAEAQKDLADDYQKRQDELSRAKKSAP
jgi:hypothetical protein